MINRYSNDLCRDYSLAKSRDRRDHTILVDLSRTALENRRDIVYSPDSRALRDVRKRP